MNSAINLKKKKVTGQDIYMICRTSFSCENEITALTFFVQTF